VVELFTGGAEPGVVSFVAIALKLMVASSGTFRARCSFDKVVI
jgi:hypothetical protein